MIERRPAALRWSTCLALARVTAVLLWLGVGRLRQEVDLDVLGGELRAEVRQRLQPAHPLLWLRPEAGGR